MRPSGPAPAVELTAHTRYRSKNEAVARSSSVLLRISAPSMQMFHAYFTRAYRYAPLHFRHVGTSGMLAQKDRHPTCSFIGGVLSCARKPAVRSVGDLAHVRNRIHARSFRGGGLRKIWGLGGSPGPGTNTHTDRKRTCGQVLNLSAGARLRVWARAGSVRKAPWVVQV